jgi:putative ABC transport system substrate-binding protein
VIVTQAAEPVEALRAATTTIPIVMASVGDALGAGYVASLAHPGGNITGVTLVATNQSTKRLQLIKELLPTISRIAVLSNANASGTPPTTEGNGAIGRYARPLVAVAANAESRRH